MKPLPPKLLLIALVLLSGCSEEMTISEAGLHDAITTDFDRGPHNGRLLQDGSFALEVTIFETGVPPEFHVWAYNNNEPVNPQDVELTVTLTRLDEQNVLNFSVEGDYLKSKSVVFEPHSFVVALDAASSGGKHHWEYESFEGRTTIVPAMSAAFGLETAIAGPAVIEQTLDVIGQITANDEYTSQITARFEGVVKSVHHRIGDRVSQGDELLTIESNESLKNYTITAPIAGVITQRAVNPGEQTSGRILLEIMDTSHVWAELSIFPSQRSEVKTGALVSLQAPASGASAEARIESFKSSANANQSVTARARLDNPDGNFLPGTFIKGRIKIAEFEVPLAVKRIGLQPFRDFSVVFAKEGDTYEVRMLELGRQDDQWIEVLGGLKPGIVYVTTNSYVLKADVEKSGASHDH